MKKVLQNIGHGLLWPSPSCYKQFFFYVPMFQGAFYSFTNWTDLTYNYKFVGLNNFNAPLYGSKIHECYWLYCNHHDCYGSW